MAALTLRLLGNPEVTVGQQPLSFPTRKVLALLIYLVVEGGMHSRESLMALLWPESPSKNAAVTLRGTLSRLRKSLQAAGQFLVSEAGKVGFDFEQSFDLDLAWLATAVLPEASPEDLPAILDLDRGEFLAGFSLPDAPDFDTWAAIQREACQRQVEMVYDRLSQHQLANHESTSAVETAARWVARASLSEVAYRRLMAAQSLAGDRPAALKTYGQCRAMLEQEFGIEPARETAVLAEHISRDRVPEGPGDVVAERGSPLVMSSPPGSRGLPLPFEGRADEHSQLVAAFRQAGEEGARVVTMIGAAGVGKTRLINAFQEWVVLDSPGVEMWQGRALEMGGRLPYQPVIEAMRVRLEQENAPEDLLEDVWLAELSQLLPELRARYPDLSPPMAGDANFVRSRLFEAMANLGSALAARHPAVFVLDDVQWADADTLDMVHYMARRWAESGVPILLLLAVRQESFAADSRLREWLTGLGRDVPLTRLLLDTLSGTAVQQLVTRLAGPAADEEATHAFAAWLWAETRGLPFFIEALLQMLVEQGIVATTEAGSRLRYDFAAALTHVQSVAHLPVPPAVRDVILTRLERLSKEAAALLLAAAVLGRECTFERLCQVADIAEQDALPALETLLRGRLLAENGPVRRPYLLAHDYIREVVYTESHEARRRVFHRRALLALEADRAPAAECAFHAIASLLDEPAFRFSLAAGDEALGAVALEEGLAHYDRAREAARMMGLGTTAVAPEHLLRLYQNRGRILELGQQDEAARANYQEMLQLAEARHDLSLKQAALTAQCIIHATHTSLFNPPQAKEMGQAALVLAQTLNDQAAQARALWCLMLAEFYGGGENQKILAYGQEALALAKKLGLKELATYVQTNLAWAYFNSDQIEAALTANNETRAVWQALGNLPMVADSYTMKLYMCRNIGKYDELLAVAPEALRLSQSINNELHEAMAWLNMSEAQCRQGRIGQALASIEACAAIIEGPTDFGSIYAHYPGLILIYLQSGALEKAEEWADKLYAFREEFMPVFQSYLFTPIARAKIARGKYQEGEAVLAQTFAVLDKDSPATIDMVPIFVADGHLQLALGNPERTLDCMKDVIQRLHQVGSRYYLAEALWLQGKAWLALEKVEQAKEALMEAKAVAEDISERTILWRIPATLSDLERVSGNEPEAEKLRGQSQEILAYIADHTGSEALRASFLAQPAVRELMGKKAGVTVL